MSLRSARPLPLLVLSASLLSAGAAEHAQAFETATHSGLTERAALASFLHQRLIVALGQALGLYEPLSLHLAGTIEDRELRLAIERLDPEGGYVPDQGRQGAMAWLAAGAALEGVPAARNRNHFYDPRRNRGLDQGGGALATRLAQVARGTGSLRGVFTGASFDGTGRAAPDWVVAPRSENPWGLNRFLDERERAASAVTQAERQDALVRALLSAGAIAHILQDMGDPAHVRNDYRVALDTERGPFEHFVATRYGRLALPEPGKKPVLVTRLAALFHGHEAGLADTTQARFFSPGTLPDPRDLPAAGFPAPTGTPPAGGIGYVAGAVRHLAAFERTPMGLRFFLDDRCHRDYAGALLPQIGLFTVAALQFLFRGQIELTESEGTITATLGDLGLQRGRLTLYADDAQGRRSRIGEYTLGASAEHTLLGTAARPSFATHATAVVRGVDIAGEPVVIVQELSLH